MSGFATANQHLASQGVTSSKFDTIGESHTGTLIEGDVVPSTDPQGNVKMRKDGVTPVMQLVILWETEERDAKIPNDKGQRKLYCSWRLEKEIKRAVRASGAEGLEEGGTLKVTFTGEERVEGALGKAKIYAAEYTAPKAFIGGTVDSDEDIPADKRAMIESLWASQQPVDLIAQVTGLSAAQVESVLGVI